MQADKLLNQPSQLSLPSLVHCKAHEARKRLVYEPRALCSVPSTKLKLSQTGSGNKETKERAYTPEDFRSMLARLLRREAGTGVIAFVPYP